MNKSERDVMGFLLHHENQEFQKLGKDIYGMAVGTGPPGKKKGRRWWQGMMLLGAELMRAEHQAALQGRLTDAEAIVTALEDRHRKSEAARCYVTKKVIFTSEARAKASRGSGTKTQRIRAYLCEHCHGWHYTSSIGKK